MKTFLQLGFLTFALVSLMLSNAYAIQVTYTINEIGGVGETSGGDLIQLDTGPFSFGEGTYQFTGSVLPDRVGLIGVSTGFRAAANRVVDGFAPIPGPAPAPAPGPGGGGGEPDDGDPGIGDGGFGPVTLWDRITVDTRVAETFEREAEILGLSPTNSTGFIQFDWVITGISNIFVDGIGLGDVTINEALTIARVGITGDPVIPDGFAHDPPAANSFISDLTASNVRVDSFQLPYDISSLAPGERPLFPVDFELFVETRLDITNNNGLGNFEALFDADFSNTATLVSVTVLDANLNVIPGASLVDSVTGGSLVAGTVVEEVSSQQCLANIAVEIGDLADAATDSADAYALNVACAALNFAAEDEFFEEDGNRLTRLGGNVFTGAAYAIAFLEYTSVEGTEDIVDRILDKLEQIVDDEIDYAIDNGGRPKFIERAEDLAEVAQWIDEDLDNPVVATVVYKLAWATAFFATY